MSGRASCKEVGCSSCQGRMARLARIMQDGQAGIQAATAQTAASNQELGGCKAYSMESHEVADDAN